jgi:predicted nucleotidyltransferase
MGRPPMRIEIINQASGIDINDCYARRNVVNADGIAISLISREDLIKNKKAAGREKDLADVENLEEMAEK